MPQYQNLLENQDIRIWKGFELGNYEKQQYVFNEKTKILVNGALLKEEHILEVLFKFILKKKYFFYFYQK